jgi:type II secretory pathway component GspD/PulD (secretin)
MNRGTVVRLAFIALAALPAAAQNSLEIIGLRHRTAEQVIPVLRPLVEPGGTLSGQGTQLFVRTSPANLAELRQALESIDRPAKRLQISVRFDDAASRSRRGVEAGGTLSNRGSNVEIRAEDRQTTSSDQVDQKIQVLDGGHAMISAGQSRPVKQRQYIQTPGGVVSQEVTVVQDRTSGFEVVPRVTGKDVQVEILQQRASRASTQRAASTVSGRLGEWFELGSVAVSGSRDETGIGTARSAQNSETRRVWIKVDELP